MSAKRKAEAHCNALASLDSGLTVLLAAIDKSAGAMIIVAVGSARVVGAAVVFDQPLADGREKLYIKIGIRIDNAKGRVSGFRVWRYDWQNLGRKPILRSFNILCLRLPIAVKSWWTG